MLIEIRRTYSCDSCKEVVTCDFYPKGWRKIDTRAPIDESLSSIYEFDICENCIADGSLLKIIKES